MLSKHFGYAICVVMALSCPALAAETPRPEDQAGPRGPVGDKEADLDSEFMELFGDQVKRVAGTPSRKDDAKLAATLLDATAILAKNPELKTFVYEKVYEFGMKDPTGHAAAEVAIRKLLLAASSQRSVELHKILLKVREAQFKTADLLGRAAARVGVVEQLVAIGDACVSAGAAGQAGPFYRRAIAAVQAGRVGGGLPEEILTKQQTAEAIRAAEPNRKRLRLALQTDPSDAKARTQLIELYLISHDSPAEAAKLLTDAVDEALRGTVTMSTQSVDKAGEFQCLHLGRWYGGLAHKAPYAARAPVLRRAVGWYEAHLEKHTADDADRDKAIKELQRLRTQLATVEKRSRKPPPPLRLRLPRTTRESRAIASKFSRGIFFAC